MHLPSREQLGSIRYHQQRLHGTGVSPPATTSNTAPATPKTVPPTPNNTPASSLAPSVTSSPSTIISDNTRKTKKIKKIKKMAKQRASRPEKRHLVRWTDEMDKKLLLAMQYQCNFAGLAVPWTEIGTIMGEGITGGAVIQHLAKLRTRMVTQGLSVPPPLKRGGAGSRISTSSSSAKAKAKATPTKNENAQANVTTTKSSRAKPKKAVKKVAPGSDESEDEDDDAGDDDDSDGDYGQRRAKRLKTDTKGPMRRRPMIEDSEEELSKPRKRKHKTSKSSSRELSAYGTTDINGVPIDDYSDDEDDEDDEDDTDSGLVAAGAPWLALEDDHVSHHNTGMKTPYKKKSLVVSLPITTHKTGMGGAIKEQETGDMDEDETEDVVIGGAIENVVEGTDVLSNEEKGQGLSVPHLQYNGNFEDVTSGTGNNNTMYGNVYHATPQVTPNAFGTTLGDPSAFNAFDGMFDNGELRFNDQSAHGSDLYNNGGFDTGAFANAEIFNGITQRDAYTYQSSIDPSTNALGGLPLINGQNYPQSVPYPIQTSWDDTYNPVGESHSTSANQTPAGTSAGVNLADGGFFNFQYDLGFEKSTMDYAANDGSDGLYHAENFDGGFDDNMFHNNLYGN